MRKLIAATAPLVIATNILAAGASAATHLGGTFTFPSRMCGFRGTSTLEVVDNFGVKADGSSFDSGRLVETFAADNGRGVRVAWDAGHEYNAPPVTNADGTTSYVFEFSGLNAKVWSLDVGLLEQGSGRIQVTEVDDADGNPVSLSVVALAGPNPNLSGSPDCSVIGPYLAGS
jgi:hypothetical protein